MLACTGYVFVNTNPRHVYCVSMFLEQLHIVVWGSDLQSTHGNTSVYLIIKIIKKFNIYLKYLIDLSNLGHLLSYLQVERIVMAVRVLRIVVEFSRGGWADKRPLALMSHGKRITAPRFLDRPLAAPFKRSSTYKLS